MPIDSWLPIGFVLHDGVRAQRAMHEGSDWQIYETQGDGRVLVARESLAKRWFEAGLLEQSALRSLALVPCDVRASQAILLDDPTV